MKKINYNIILIIILLFKSALIYNIYLVSEETKYMAVDLSITLLKNEILFISPLLILNLFLKNNKNKFIKYSIFLLNLIISISLIIDLFILVLFKRRLIIFEYIQYIDFSKNIIIMCIGILIILILIILMSIFLQKLLKNKSSYIYILIPIIFLIPYEKYNFFKKDLLTNNLFTLNKEFKYINNFKNQKKLAKNYQKKYISKIEKGENKNINIIVLIGESWSAIDSKYTTGILNNFKKFDKITKDEGMLLKNLFSEATQTAEAFISFYNGMQIIKYKITKNIFTPYFFKNNLIKNLNINNYHTEFIRTVPLTFLKQNKYMSFLKFNKISDGINVFNKHKKYSIGGEDDNQLFKYSKKRIKELLNNNTKFFLNILTFSTHIPYETPFGNNEKKAFEFADNSFSDFYNFLKKINYFENGILIVFGDHAKMENLPKYNNEEYTRVIGAIFGKGIKKGSINYNYYNISDISNSIMYKTSKSFKKNSLYNNIFTETNQRNYSLHSKYSKKSEVNLYYNDKTSDTFEFDGDNSHFKYKNKNSTKKIKKYLIELISYLKEEKFK